MKNSIQKKKTIANFNTNSIAQNTQKIKGGNATYQSSNHEDDVIVMATIDNVLER